MVATRKMGKVMTNERLVLYLYYHQKPWWLLVVRNSVTGVLLLDVLRNAIIAGQIQLRVHVGYGLPRRFSCQPYKDD